MPKTRYLAAASVWLDYRHKFVHCCLVTARAFMPARLIVIPYTILEISKCNFRFTIDADDDGISDLLMRKKNNGFTPNLDFNPLATRFNFTELLPPTACIQSDSEYAFRAIQRVCSTSREKRSNHGISILLKQVCIEKGCIYSAPKQESKTFEIFSNYTVKPSYHLINGTNHSYLHVHGLAL